MKQFINVKRVFTVLIILLLLISCRVETDYCPLANVCKRRENKNEENLCNY